MSKLKTLPEVARFASILRQSELDSRCADQAVERVAYLVSDFESRLENRAGIRVRRSIRAEVRKTVGHLTTAARNTDDDSPTRNDARKLIRFAGCCSDFVELQYRASAYRGRHNSIVRRLNDRKKRKQARSISIDDSHRVLEIKTTGHLRSVGKALRNCIGNRRRSSWYYEALRRGDTQFWVLLRGTEPLGLLAVCPKSREIGECAGPDNDPTGCSREFFLALQREMGVYGDDIDEIAEVGAFSLFATEPDIPPEVVQVGRQTYRIWGRTGEVILCDDRERWSRLVFKLKKKRGTNSCVSGPGHLDEAALLELVLDSPKLQQAVNRYRPSLTSPINP